MCVLSPSNDTSPIPLCLTTQYHVGKSGQRDAGVSWWTRTKTGEGVYYLVLQPGNVNGWQRSTAQCIFTRHWADCHIATSCDTTLHDAVSDLFSLAPNNLDFLTGEHMRSHTNPSSVRINFKRPFVTPPKVVVFLDHINLGKDNTWRLKTTAVGINTNGFTLSIETLSSLVCKLAGSLTQKIASTSLAPLSTRRKFDPYMRQHQQSRAIEFNGVEFRKDPSVFVASNSFDIDHGANFRVNAYAGSDSKTGLVWHIDSWSDTILYSAGASIIAFKDWVHGSLCIPLSQCNSDFSFSSHSGPSIPSCSSVLCLM